jgi:glycosyltransferase involved in cell wall biosynthesis
MRILYAHSFYRIAGGEDRHVREQVELVSRAHDVELIAASNTDLPDTTRTAIRMMYSRRKKQEILETIDRFSPEVLHIHNAYPSLGPSVILAAYERGIPIVMTVHNMRLRCPNGLMFTQRSLCRRCEAGMYANAVIHRCLPTTKQASAYAGALWIHRFIMRLEDRVARFIAPSDFIRERLIDWKIAPDRVEMIRNFTHATQTSTAGSGGTYGMFVGRLSVEKGVDVLLGALHRAGDPPFRIVGDGPARSALERMAHDLKLKNTAFMGWRTPGALANLLDGARYVALPSVWEENAPLVALEALATGRPLIVSDVGGLPELVESGSGVVAGRGDSDDLADKIQLLVDNDDACARASHRATAFAHRWLRPEQHLGNLESLYTDVIDGRRKAAIRRA